MSSFGLGDKSLVTPGHPLLDILSRQPEKTSGGGSFTSHFQRAAPSPSPSSSSSNGGSAGAESSAPAARQQHRDEEPRDEETGASPPVAAAPPGTASEPQATQPQSEDADATAGEVAKQPIAEEPEQPADDQAEPAAAVVNTAATSAQADAATTEIVAEVDAAAIEAAPEQPGPQQSPAAKLATAKTVLETQPSGETSGDEKPVAAEAQPQQIDAVDKAAAAAQQAQGKPKQPSQPAASTDTGDESPVAADRPEAPQGDSRRKPAEKGTVETTETTEVVVSELQSTRTPQRPPLTEVAAVQTPTEAADRDSSETAPPQPAGEAAAPREAGNNVAAATSQRHEAAHSRYGLVRGAARVEGQESPGATPADRARFVQRVARAFELAETRGGKLTLRLSPPELGSLRLELHVTEGVIRAKLEAETQTARSLLLENLPALRERLQTQQIRVEQFDIDLMDFARGGQPQNQQHQGADHRPPRGDSVLPPVAPVAEERPADRGRHRGAAADGRLNVVV